MQSEVSFQLAMQSEVSFQLAMQSGVSFQLAMQSGVSFQLALLVSLVKRTEQSWNPMFSQPPRTA